MTKQKVTHDTTEYKVPFKKSYDRHYTVGEIFRLGLLKNWQGRPYADKATVLKIIKKYGKYHRAIGKYGPSILVSVETINKINKQNHD